VGAELLPQRSLGSSLVEQSLRHPRATQPLPQLQCSDVRCRWRGAGCSHLSIVRRSLRHHAAVRPHHQYLGRRPGGWPNRPPRLTPPGGKITISRGLDRLAAPGRPALRARPPTPLVRVVGNQRLRSCRYRLLLLRPRGSGRGMWRPARRRHTCRRPRCPLRAALGRQRSPQLERLDRRKGGDGWQRPDNERKAGDERLRLKI
jgi:hypothetical protein